MDTIEITLPVSPMVAERCRSQEARARLGAFLSAVSAPGITEAEVAEAVRLFTAPEDERRRALREAFGEMQQAAAEAGITPHEIEAELAGWKRERAAARRR